MNGKLPETRYADSNGVAIAYQVMGADDKDYDIVIAPCLISHVEDYHEFSGYTEYLERPTTFARVVTFDKRGQGLSERIEGAPSLEQRADDISAVMDAAGSEKAIVFGHSDGGSMAVVFAATYPERTTALMLFAVAAKLASAPDYPYMPSLD